MQVGVQAGYESNTGWMGRKSGYAQGWAGPHISFPHSHPVHSDSDSDEEDTQFFSMASGAPQTPAPEPSRRQSQSTFSTLVTVLKGRITAFCEAKVRPRAGEPRAPHKPTSFKLGTREQKA